MIEHPVHPITGFWNELKFGICSIQELEIEIGDKEMSKSLTHYEIMERNKIQGAHSVCIFDPRFNKINDEDYGYKNNWDVEVTTAFKNVFETYTGSFPHSTLSHDIQIVNQLRQNPKNVYQPQDAYARSCAMYAFRHFGYNIVSLCPDLLNEFIDSRIQVESKDLKFPFNAFAIEVPDIAPLRLSKKNGYLHASTIYVFQQPGAVVVYPIFLGINPTVTDILDSINPPFVVDIIEGKNICDIIDEHNKKAYEASIEVNRKFNVTPNDDEVVQFGDAIHNIVFSTILYISSFKNSDITYLDPQSPTSKKKKHNPNKSSRFRKVVLGRNHVSGYMSQTSLGSKQNVPHSVRGHWRTYSDDRYTEERRSAIQWIRPHIRVRTGTAEASKKKFLVSNESNADAT